MGLFGPPQSDKVKARFARMKANEKMKDRVFRMKDRENVRGLIKALVYKDDSVVRIIAADALGHIGNAHAVEPLIALLLRNMTWDEGKAAARALGQIGDARAVQPLIAALKYKEERDCALEALGKIGSPSVDLLISALGAKDETIRPFAAEALGQIGDKRAVEPLITALNNKYLSTAAANALAKIGWEPDQDELGAVYWIARKKWEKCVEIGALAVELLINNLYDLNACEALGQIGDPRAVEPLITLLNSPERRRRSAAAEALLALYQSGGIEQKHRLLILAQHPKITQEHMDNSTHTDRREERKGKSSDCIHEDSNKHQDAGIGIEFPV